MEGLRKTVWFALGFVAAASLVIVDDRMAMNYGYDSGLDVNREVREVAAAVDEYLEEAEQMGTFFGRYFEELITAAREGGKDAPSEEPPALEAFKVQKF